MLLPEWELRKLKVMTTLIAFIIAILGKRDAFYLKRWQDSSIANFKLMIEFIWGKIEWRKNSENPFPKSTDDESSKMCANNWNWKFNFECSIKNHERIIKVNGLEIIFHPFLSGCLSCLPFVSFVYSK